jgi:type IV fimbrial biogenesis protein FimT
MKRRGVTLIEMLVAIALVGIVLGLSAPAFSDMIARQRVRSYTDGLVTDIAFARSEAVSRKQAVRIALGSTDSGNCYTIYVSSGGNCSCTSCPVDATELKTVRVPRSDGVRVVPASADGPLVVDFDAVRAAPSVANYDVNLSHSRGPQLRARITPLGQVRVCSPNGSISGVTSPCP